MDRSWCALPRRLEIDGSLPVIESDHVPRKNHSIWVSFYESALLDLSTERNLDFLEAFFIVPTCPQRDSKPTKEHVDAFYV